jgi:hypothetical protein
VVLVVVVVVVLLLQQHSQTCRPWNLTWTGKKALYPSCSQNLRPSSVSIFLRSSPRIRLMCIPSLWLPTSVTYTHVTRNRVSPPKYGNLRPVYWPHPITNTTWYFVTLPIAYVFCKPAEF